MATLAPLSLPDDEVQRYLVEGERVVSSFGPYHATSRRVILLLDSRREEREATVHELLYTDLESITEVKATDRRKMLLGAGLAGAGFATLFFWYLVAPIISIVAGLCVILQGATEKPAYYQLKGRSMEGEELRKWQVVHYGAGSFIASISTMTGVEAERD